MFSKAAIGLFVGEERVADEVLSDGISPYEMSAYALIYIDCICVKDTVSYASQVAYG